MTAFSDCSALPMLARARTKSLARLFISSAGSAQGVSSCSTSMGSSAEASGWSFTGASSSRPPSRGFFFYGVVFLYGVFFFYGVVSSSTGVFFFFTGSSFPPVRGRLPPVRGRRPPVRGRRPPCYGSSVLLYGVVLLSGVVCPPVRGSSSFLYGRRPSLYGVRRSLLYRGLRPPVRGRSSSLYGVVVSCTGSVVLAVRGRTGGRRPSCTGRRPPVRGASSNGVCPPGTGSSSSCTGSSSSCTGRSSCTGSSSSCTRVLLLVRGRPPVRVVLLLCRPPPVRGRRPPCRSSLLYGVVVLLYGSSYGSSSSSCTGSSSSCTGSSSSCTGSYGSSSPSCRGRRRPPVRGRRPPVRGRRPPVRGRRPPVRGRRPPVRVVVLLYGRRPPVRSTGSSSSCTGRVLCTGRRPPVRGRRPPVRGRPPPEVGLEALHALLELGRRQRGEALVLEVLEQTLGVFFYGVFFFLRGLLRVRPPSRGLLLRLRRLHHGVCGRRAFVHFHGLVVGAVAVQGRRHALRALACGVQLGRLGFFLVQGGNLEANSQ
ncbi:hypothetical protein C7M84_015188 [Penaeus vannamei]|uniref:Uncharacterized protein n=1 Tax=Penaeus vannamei TaxID=6689 RepID=A0A423SRA6_PENVA|nr:hypothetical protein C7M84_015188 [Penaeus vannamei]